jgi:hypothetical protein
VVCDERERERLCWYLYSRLEGERKRKLRCKTYLILDCDTWQVGRETLPAQGLP